jgi:hypothetical protein
MDAAELRETIEESMAVELERLGSSKLLVAHTGADLSAEHVLWTVADAERAAADTFDAWAAAEDHDEARRFFAECREQERDHYDRVVDMLEGTHAADDATAGPMHERLRSFAATPARLGGLVGRAMVGDRAHLQVVSFFVNEGQEGRADSFRELRSETRAQGDRALELLEAVCAGREDRDRALAAAEEAIDAAYGSYADSLDELGLDPKPIC